MLSRRRSSERASVALSVPPPATQTPSQRRLDAALRGASILFSVQAQLDATAPSSTPSTTASAALPRQALPRRQDLSGDLIASDVTGMRRLFSRESRLRRSRTPTPGDTRPTHHLAVASHGKNADVIRIHQLVDHGPGARAAVHRTWPLADLRKIDGLGKSVKDSLQFMLYFSSSNRTTAWRCNTPLQRAIFLWSLLETCVSQRKRAPPVTNLSLLDLKTMAESSADCDNADPDDSSSGAFQPAAKQNRLTSSLDELAADREQQSDDLMRATADPSDSSVNQPTTPNQSTTASTLAAPNNSASGPANSHGQRLFEDVEEDPSAPSGERRRGDSPDSLTRTRGRITRDLTSQKVQRTLSEPKAGKLNVEPTGDSDIDSTEFIPKKADTIAPGQRPVDPKLKDLNIDERAFLAAAKRMGANRSFEMKRLNPDRSSIQESGPKAKLFQHRLKMGEANTAKVVAERKLQQEKKLLKLSPKEQRYLSCALERFRSEKQTEPLSDFGSWAEARIHMLEVENIADIVNVEKRTMPHWLGDHQARDLLDRKGLDDFEEGKWPYDLLVDSMSLAEPWLEKCQTLLAPYAALAGDINRGVTSLEIQRRNASNLNGLLAELIETLSFERAEQSLVDGIESADTSLSLSEFDGEDFQAAAHVIASKITALQRLSSLSDMAAVVEVRNLLSQRQREASSVLLPMLRGHINEVYEGERVRIANREFQKLRRGRVHDLRSPERQEFLVGVESLAVFGRKEFLDLVKHFISLSSSRVIQLFQLGVEAPDAGNPDISYLIARAEQLSQSLFYAAVLEGCQACHLFGRAMKTRSCEEIDLPQLLQRQIKSDTIIHELVTSGTGDNKALQTCLHLRTSYHLRYLSQKVEVCRQEQTIEALLLAVEACLGDGNVNSALSTKTMERRNSSAKSLETNDNETTVRSGSRLHSEYQMKDTASSPTRTEAGTNSSGLGNLEHINGAISNFFDVCDQVSKACDSCASGHVNSAIASLSTPVDINSDYGRAESLSYVQRTVDLCDMLTSPSFGLFDGPAVTPAKFEATQSLCERLVAAAMRSIEISTHSCIERVSDVVKIQCYGYIAAKLGTSEKPDFLVPLAHLSSRVWKHVMAKWAERELFGSLLAGVIVEATRRPAESHARFLSAVAELDVAQTVSRMKETLLSALGTATKTVVLEACCNNLVALTKEKLEDALRRAKKQRLSSEGRSRLLFFSKELLRTLRVEFEGTQTVGTSR